MTEMSVRTSEAILQPGSAGGASAATRCGLPNTSLIQFDNCEIDRSAHEFRRDGNPSPIEPQVFDLLTYLVDNAGRLVTKDELIAKVWHGRIVSDAALSSRIKSARRAIGDDGDRQRLIKTVHGRGFRFVGELKPVRAGDDERCSGPTNETSVAVVGPAAQSRSNRGSSRPSISVRPLHAVGSDPADHDLAEAVTEDLVTCLARDRSLPVLTAGRFLAADGSGGGGPQPPRALERHYVLEGGVRRISDRLFVTIRLTDAEDGRHIWAERCEQKLGPTLAADDRIARMISAAARGEIEIAEARKASARPEQDRDAWAFYHLGLKELYRFTQPGLAAARAYFEQAVAIDPDFASAHARLAYVHIQYYWYGPRDLRALALTRAQATAGQAIALDQKNALGYFALGRVHALRHEFDIAMPAFETAIRLNPGLAQAYFALGQAYFFAGRPKEAVRLLDDAIDLDPHDPHLWAFLHDQADAYYALGQLDEAAKRAKAASRFPNSTHWPLASLASVLGAAGAADGAQDALRELRAHLPEYTLSLARTDLAHIGNRTYVERFLEGLKLAGLPDDSGADVIGTPAAMRPAETGR